jgi:hypothetical protein
MPHAIRLIDEHVVHLHRKVHVVRRMPGIAEYSLVDTEGARTLSFRLEHVDTRFAHAAEVEREVLVAQVLSPAGRCSGLHFAHRPVAGGT